MNMTTKTTGSIFAISASLIGAASAHPGAPGHTHGDDWPFGVVAVAIIAASAGLYGVFLKVRDSRKPEPVKVRVRRD